MPPLFIDKGKAKVVVDTSKKPHRMTLTVGDKSYRGIYKVAREKPFGEEGGEEVKLHVILSPPGEEPVAGFPKGGDAKKGKAVLYICQPKVEQPKRPQ